MPPPPPLAGTAVAASILAKTSSAGCPPSTTRSRSARGVEILHRRGVAAGIAPSARSRSRGRRPCARSVGRRTPGTPRRARPRANPPWKLRPQRAHVTRRSTRCAMAASSSSSQSTAVSGAYGIWRAPLPAPAPGRPCAGSRRRRKTSPAPPPQPRLDCRHGHMVRYEPAVVDVTGGLAADGAASQCKSPCAARRRRKRPAPASVLPSFALGTLAGSRRA